ncbi:MAG: AbrB/MazE/SpoVT family DNA-binding domain-containing protein [Anaerolineae bacterium]|jgi:antitoxin component of MazEF toxin-antitoxin module|nr:AbrB/MazE/SpoVT family DNA-binding domain-containing protein [Anaerolineae bacterium]MBT7323660.1 AbrB/MazE/SpoVT family DNA-binding domain-containing protein [Anaerolineae bacterium]
MRRQIRQSANSQIVSLPEDMLTALELQEGSDIDVFVNQQGRQIIIRSTTNFSSAKIDTEFARQINDFIEEYQSALKELAK